MGEGAVIAASVNLVLSYHFGQHNSCLNQRGHLGRGQIWTAARAFRRRSEQAPAPAVERLANTEDECFRARTSRDRPSPNRMGRTIHTLMNLQANSSRSTHFIMAERGLE